MITKIRKTVKNFPEMEIAENENFTKICIDNSSSVVSLTQSWKCCKCRVENYNDKWKCSHCHHERCRSCIDLLG